METNVKPRDYLLVVDLQSIDDPTDPEFMANVSDLQPALPPQVQTSSSEAPEKNADFLALRLVNKRARVRLSPEPVALASFPGKACLFAIVNSRGWFAAVTRETGGASVLVFSPLADLRTTLATASADDQRPFKPQRRVPISGATPHIITFACNDTRLLLGLVDGSIHVYASDQLLSSGEGPVQPIHIFTTSSAALLSIQANPGDIPELIAVLRDCAHSPGSLAVELLDVQKFISSGGWLAGKSPSTTPTSISWSPKGKQLALGLQSGDIVTFSPTATATPKSCIPHPPSASNMSVISIHWLSTTSFHTIYAPPGKLSPDVEQIHFHSSLDSKHNSAQDVKFSNPYLPFPGLRPPGEFLGCLRDWNPSKVLLFIGDSTSSDIGLIGSVVNESGESWHNLSLEETSTPSLPLDSDQNDTILLGMDIDLTSSESYHHSAASGEALELPAHPIMYVYASDGTILGWHVLNVTGAPYPGMVTGINTSISEPNGPSRLERELSDMQMTPAISPTGSSLMETSATKLPSAVFGQPSPFGTSGSVFGQPSTFGQTAPGASQQPTPVFSKPPLTGQSATTPVSGSTTVPSLFGQLSAPALGSALSGGGFGAFSSAGPAKFGQTTFGFGGPPQTTTSTPPPPTSVPEENMASDDAPPLGGFGLGAANTQDADSRPSIFGNTSVPVSSAPESTGSGLIKTGFGAFGGFDQTSPFAKPPVFTSGFPSATPGPSIGAFSSLKTSLSSFVKPPSGVFGELPKESPFFAPAKSVESKPASAFALSATTNSMPPKISSTQPTFGSSSLPGGGVQSVFAPPSATPAQPPPASAGTFGKFSGSGGFAAFSSGGTKSFSDLLRTGGVEKPAAFEDTPTKPAQLTPKAPASTTSAFTDPNGPPKPSTSTGSSFMPRKTSFTQPTFGSSSMPGGEVQSAPASVSATPAQPPPASAGAFSGFSGSGGFAAFSSGGTKSFSDLLRTGGLEKPAASEETHTKLAQPTPQAPVSTTPTFTVPNALPKPSTSTGGDFMPPKTSFSQPTFGSSSMPGGGVQSAPASVSATPAQPHPASAGAFSGFSGSGGFAAFSSGGTKSFSDLLRTGGLEKPAASEETHTKPVQPTPQAPVSTTPTFTNPIEPPKPSTSTGGDFMPPKTSFSQPTFESSSMPGGGVQSAPASVSAPLAQLPSASAGAFSAFSGSGGFAAFSPGGTKSFSDLLRTGGAEKPPGSAPSEETATKPAPQAPVSAAPTFTATSVSTPAKEPVTLPAPPVVVKDEKEVVEIKALPSPPASATSVSMPSKEPVKAPPPPVVKKVEPDIVEVTASEVFVETGEVGEGEEGEEGEIEEGGESGEGESILSEVPSEDFEEEEEEEEEEESEAVEELVKELVEEVVVGEEEVQKPVVKETKPPPAPAPVPSPTPEQGMQVECAALVGTLEKELETLKQRAMGSLLMLAKLQKKSGVAHQMFDLADPRKWAFGDIEEYGRLLVDIQVDVKELKLEPTSLRKFLKELDSNMLKINARKEEIARFDKAKMDADFRKILKIRTLAPEYVETQSQLRKSIRAIKDRVQKLEDHLQGSKKRINELRTGRPSLRPPSLDTVNRTFRNIDVAIERQKHEMSLLRQRMAGLEIGGVSTREQVAVSSPKQPLNVTPNVAITTAAALNAERSAQKLKKALLASRTQPLLNTSAVVKTSVVEVPKSVFALPPAPATPMMSFPLSLPAWTPPPPSGFAGPAMHDLSLSRNRPGLKHHQKPIALKKNPSPAGSTTPPSSLFEWKQVEPVKPVSSLPFAIRPAGSR